MHNGTLKTICSVIKDKSHYKGNTFCLVDDNRIIIKGIYPCEIAISSIVDYHYKNCILFFDLHLTINDINNNKEKLVIRIPYSKKSKLIAQSIVNQNRVNQGTVL